METAKRRNAGEPRIGADLEDRTLTFAVRLVAFVNSLPPTTAGRTVAGQLLRAGTAIGANYREANRAESRADFAHKIGVSLKEAAETEYWLMLCIRCDLGSADERTTLGIEATELIRILSSISQEARAART